MHRCTVLSSVCCCLLLLLTTSLVRCEEEKAEVDGESVDVKEDDDVLVLTSDTFDDLVYSKEIILVEFYAPWCGHCKTLAPIYAKAAKVLKENDPPVALAKVDAVEQKDLATRFEVSGYPTLKFFKNGQVYDYTGPRDEEGIVEYMKERADPDWKPPKDHVLVLTKDNFTEFVTQEKLSLVEFYAPWCGHCKKLAPEYSRAAAQLIDRGHSIPLAKVDASIETEIAAQYSVVGYPTLKIFREGRVFEYKGPREEYGIVNYMIVQEGEASKEILNLKEFKKYIQEDDITMVGFFEKMDNPSVRIFMDAANEVRGDYKYGHTFDGDVRRINNVEPGTMVLFIPERFQTKYEPKRHILKLKNISTEDILKFVRGREFPLVGHYTWSTEKKYNKRYPLCLVFYTVDWSFDHRDATQMWRNKIAQIADEYRDITFAIINEEDFVSLFSDFGFDESGEDMNIGILTDEGKRYSMEPMSEFDADEIREFLDNFKKGKLKTHIKSQAVPKQDSGPVRVVVARNFEEVVLDSSKDVLVELYAPWCGHCKQLEPVYKKLAKSVKDEKNLIIAKMDATANDIPSEYKVEGFPTIYFAPSNNKVNPIKYESGSRKVGDFVKFLTEHATVSMGKTQKEEL